MKKYDLKLKQQIILLRTQGYTYPEIQKKLGLAIPRTSLSYICKDVIMSLEGKNRILSTLTIQRNKARSAAIKSNRITFEQKLQILRNKNKSIADFMSNREAQLIALAMLYLGEGAKWQNSRSPKLGSSSPFILRLYIDLLIVCYKIPLENLRARIQHRADQDSNALLEFWSSVTQIPTNQFYTSYIDKRTIGKITTKQEYKGVCTVSCAGTYIQLELAEIAGIIGESIGGISSVD